MLVREDNRKFVRFMNTSFVVSSDETRIAYDVTGEGSVIMLLHGGWHTRQSWHDVGYVKRLKDNFKVIAIDIRGNGESDKPIDPIYYTTEKMCQDILAVADACNVEKFTIWGFSYGGNIGRYLAAQFDRVEKIIIMGIPFGLGASGDFRQFIEEFCDHWKPILQAQSEGTLDIACLSQKDQEALHETNIALDVAWLSAILDWRAIEPADIGCQALWLVGSENEPAIASISEYEEKLRMSKVRVEVIEGLSHMEEFTEIDRNLPVTLAFMANDV
jgi:pimeloyl-ACP methyl ester carboxylesterase